MSGPTLTDQQRRALDVVGASVALGAGAGCGKTTVLAERFVRALEGPDPLPLGRVVALTFTNKAARELRGRIRAECRSRLASGGDPDRWRPILRGLAAARIGTFHGFCGTVLRRHAVQAGIDPGFTVLDEPIAGALRDDALSAAIRQRLADRDRDLIDLAVEFGMRGVRQALGAILANRSGGDIHAWTSKEPRELVDHWHDRWVKVIRPALVAQFIESARPCLDRIDLGECDHPKVVVRLAEVRDAFAVLADSVEPGAALKAIGEVAKVQGTTAKGCWPSTDVYECFKGHFDSIRKEAGKLIDGLLWDERVTMDAARQGLAFARLAARARESYDLAKRERGGLDNDDLLLMTRDLLEGHGGEVRRQLGESVALILVDEFQDTDPIQGSILDHLAGPDLAGGKLFLVGDFKQSIYRFRGARPELFLDYRAQFPEDGRLALTENFRSVPAVLDFVNALFADTFPPGEGAALVAGGGPSGLEGLPAVGFLWGDPNTVPAPGKPDADVRRRDEARRLAGYLRHRLDEGWTVRDRETKALRAANQGDIAFLFRSLADASAYEQALVAEGLDYHVVGGSGFFAQQEVLDLINVLSAVEDPLDGVAMAGALRSPFFCLSDDALVWIANERKGFPHAGLDRCEGDWLDRLPEADRPLAARARRLLDDWRSAKDRVSIAELVDRILDESGYEAALPAEFLGDRKRANARKLVRMARRFDAQGGFTLADFVDRLRADLRAATKETQAATTDETGEFVRLMSVHQAKGLEFPIVVLPDLDRKRPGELRRVAFDPDLGPLVNPSADPEDEADAGGSLGWSCYRHAEERADDAEALRLFYVATTRARDFLLLSSATDPTKKPTSPALALLNRRFDRATGRLKVELPDGLTIPHVEVIPLSHLSPPSSQSASNRPHSRPIELADLILGAPRTESALGISFPSRPPRLVELDPAAGLSSTSGRLDRLIRSILGDPRGLDPTALARVAARSARLQNPIAPPALVALAVDRVAAWARTPLARELARSTIARRRFEWQIAWPTEVAQNTLTTLYRGVGDFLDRDPSGDARLVIVSDPEASEAGELLRLLLAARAAGGLGLGPVRRAWWLRLGPGGGLRGYDDFGDRAIEAAVRAWRESDR